MEANLFKSESHFLLLIEDRCFLQRKSEKDRERKTHTWRERKDGGREREMRERERVRME